MQTITSKELAQTIVQELSLKQKAQLLSQVVWETTNVGEIHPGLSKFLLADGPAGIRRLKEYFDEDIYNTKPSTCYPSPSAYASSWNRSLIRKLGEHFAIEAHQEEVDTMLAPAVNIKRSPLGGRNFEYYSEDPYVAGELATEFIQGMQGAGVGACLKHFAANNQETRRMNINAIIDEQTLHEVYLAAFEKPVKEGKPYMVMTAYNQINGEYCASNQELLHTLRHDWGFDGVVVTDCFAAHDLAQGIKAGLSLQMPGETGRRITERVEELIIQGSLAESELDRAVARNIEFALNAGDNRVTATYDREAHHAFARQVAEESIVLLKNNQALPLSEKESVLVVGELAMEPRFQGGGSSHVNPYRLEIPFEELQRSLPNAAFLQGYQLSCQADDNLKNEVLQAAQQYDTVLVYAGIPDLIESEGYDRPDIALPQVQNELITALTKIHHKVIVVLANGSVVEMPWVHEVAGIVEGYLGGEAGASAMVNVLLGRVNPSGKLAETFPLRLADNPSYLYFPGNENEVIYGEGRFVGYKYYEALEKPVLFPFGHGLSYTQFALSETVAPVIDSQNLKMTCRLENIGDVSGKEVVQVYVERMIPGQSREPKRLVGFEKIELVPGESHEIVISLDSKTFMAYSAVDHDWEIMNGTYEFTIGFSVQDIRLTTQIEMNDQPMIIHPDSNLGDMIQISGMYEQLKQAFASHPASLRFLEMTQDDDPLKAISMGSLMTLNTLKRVDDTLLDQDIEQIVATINHTNQRGE